MTTKKKKTSNNFTKQSEAHYKNVFFQKVLEIATIVSETNSNKLISNHILEDIYENRVRSLKVVADDDLNFSSKDLQDIKESIVHHLKNRAFNFVNDTRILHFDYLGPGLSLWIYLDYLKRNHPEKSKEILFEFSEFIDSDKMSRILQTSIYTISDIISWDLTSLDKRIISLKLNFIMPNKYCFNIYPEVSVHVYPSQMISICINGNNRPAYRVGITSEGSPVIWLDMEGVTETFGLHHLSPETKIPVYIQHHALNRLKERLDLADNCQILVSIENSISKKECIYYHGHWLMAYYFAEYKIGYLMLDIVNDVIVIRTFLLLTHFDTPEGDSLRKIIGFEKPDISYLNLDKLSTFVFSGFRENQLLCDLFNRAGCNPLIDVPKKEFDKKNYTISASIIESYLGKYQDHKARLRLENLFAS